MKVSVRDGKISDETTMGKRLERFGGVRIVGETNGFGLDILSRLHRVDFGVPIQL